VTRESMITPKRRNPSFWRADGLEGSGSEAIVKICPGGSGIQKAMLMEEKNDTNYADVSKPAIERSAAESSARKHKYRRKGGSKELYWSSGERRQSRRGINSRKPSISKDGDKEKDQSPARNVLGEDRVEQRGKRTKRGDLSSRREEYWTERAHKTN